VQLDDRALFLERWRTIILEQLRPETVAGDSLCAEFRRLVRDGWTGRADVGSVGYRLVRAFRLQLFEEVYGWLTAPCRQADPAFDFHVIPRWEDPLWTLVNQRPPHLLSSHYASWDSVFVNVADEVVRWLNRDGRPLVSRTWGEFNTTAIRHPLSRAVPLVGRWLDMPAHQLPGDSHMPRVQHPAMGASERLVVAPGRPEQGILQMPCGQSGHPLSPYWRAGHQAWEEGRPTPLLPGEPRWRLLLRPR
jgi:penicillin amidase